MIQRSIARTVLTEAGQYPVLTLIGPRQSGKTTLVRELFPAHRYVNLEYPRQVWQTGSLFLKPHLL
ncbi:AAA family ATPase [Spirochaeta dissipatitropha]